MKKYLLYLLIIALFYCPSDLLAHGTGPGMSGGTGPISGTGGGVGLSDPMTTRGDVIVRNSSNATARLGIGANGEVLSSDGTDVSWSSAGAGDVTAGANLGDNLLIRGDGATKGVQNSGITVDDSDNIAALGNITGVAGQMTITGGTASGDDLLLLSTSNGTKGTIALGSLTAGLVYDETNVRLSIGSDENTVVVNTTTIGSKITTHTEGATDLLDISPHRHSDTAAFGAAMGFTRSRGSEGSETAVVDNDFIMRINGYGHDGTDYEIAAQIDFEVDGTVGANQMGGAIVFSTTADGANSVTERMRIGSDGAITMGSGTPDIQFTTDGSGAMTWAAINQPNNENLIWDLESGTNTTTVSTSTGVTLIDFSAIGLTTTGNVHGGTMSIATQLTITPQANPTTDADGEIAIDIDGWGTNFDAIEFFNSTASAYVVATTASDAPSNGQVPKWNTGGAITWENDNDTGGAPEGTAVLSTGEGGGTKFLREDGDNSSSWQALPVSNTTTSGTVEASIASEVTTGTDAARSVTPDSLAGSEYGERAVVVYLNADTALTTGDGKAFFAPLESMAGWDLIGVVAYRSIGGGTDTYTIRNVTQGADVLSTAITIDAGELTSATAAVPAVIDTAQDDVTLNDQYEVNVDGVGTDSAHVRVQGIFRLP